MTRSAHLFPTSHRARAAWLLGLLAALLILAACGSDGDPAASVRDEPATATDAQAQPEPDDSADTPNPAAEEDEPPQDPAPEAEPGNAPDEPAEDPQDTPEEPEPPAARDEPLPYDQEFALDVLETLTVEIGPRARGTPGETAAADFLAETFERLGYAVERQAFALPFHGVTGLSVSVEGEEVAAEAFLRTAGGTAEGRLVLVPGFGTTRDFDAVDVAGAIALVERGILFFQDKVDNAAAAGAAAVLVFNNEAGGFTGALDRGSQIPAATLSRETGLALKERAGAGPIAARVEIEGGRRTVVSENVIASSGDGPCRVYVGGHYDSVIDVPGANDNGSGTALVVALAQAFAGVPAADLVCFVGFAAEEAVGGIGGIAGSDFLVRDLVTSGEIDRVTAMLNLDVAAVGGEVIVAVGSPRLAEWTVAIAEALGIPARQGSLPANTGSDHVNFLQAGVPVIFPTLFGGAIHVPSDVFEAIQPERFEAMGVLARAVLQCLIVEAGGELPAPAGCTAGA